MSTANQTKDFRSTILDLGKSTNKVIDSFGDKIESGFESFGSYSNETIDLIGNQLQNVPHFGTSLNDLFDAAGDSVENFFDRSGEYIDDKLDQFGDKIEALSKNAAEYFSI